MKNICLFLAEGFEEIEAVVPVDLLRRAGINCIMVSVTEKLQVKGAHDIIITADVLFDECFCMEADGIILPGGAPGWVHLNAHEGVKNVIRKFDEEKKLIAAICAAPAILGGMGILADKNAVCYPGKEESLTGAFVGTEDCVNHEHIVTSRGAGTSMAFAFKIIEMLLGTLQMQEIKNSIVF